MENVPFIIEVRDLPEAVSALEEIAYRNQLMKDTGKVKDNVTRIWDILRINDEGVSLYITNSPESEQIADAFIFIPRENIIAIHTVDREFLESCFDFQRKGHD